MSSNNLPQPQRCINCSIVVTRFERLCSLDQLSNSMLNILSSWIAPTSITDGHILCFQCLTLIQSHSASDVIPAPQFGHEKVCFGCGKSILRAPSRRVSLDCPERNVILRRTAAHQVSRLTRVCEACWRSANREIQRQRQFDTDRPILQEINLSQNEISTPRLSNPNSTSLPKITSTIYKRAANTDHCIFLGCTQIECVIVPKIIREMLLLRNKFYVSSRARICHSHLENGRWSDLTSDHNDFTGTQFDEVVNLLSKDSLRRLDFENIDLMAPDLCHYWLGMSAEQFDELYACVPSLSQELKKPRFALCIYIVKLRTGDSNDRLSSLFKIARSTLEKKMNIARKCLIDDFVSRYLGFDHLTVEQVASRNKIIPERLFGNPILPEDTKPAIVMCDATYIYVQKSSNYLFQKDTYSLQKSENLIKPFMIVCCDGYIIDCLGPFKATTNDATITQHDIQSEESKLCSFFRQGDIFLLDRGFRDVVELLQELGFTTHMPESILEDEHQLTTFQANKSRCVTMCRWVVEIVNGRIKRDFRLFRKVFNNRAVPHLWEDFRIACALLNKFHRLIEDPPHALEYATIAQRRLHLPNHLSSYIENARINRRRAMFTVINSEHPHLNSFPRLSIDDLKRFALGSYQLKQARSYYGEHTRSSGMWSVEVNSEIDEDVPLILGLNNYLIRGRIKSRHVSGHTHFTYILVSRDTSVANTLDALVGYCCSCKAGKRTVGCCAHIMTVVWYLSWGRFNDVQAPASFLDDLFEEGI